GVLVDRVGSRRVMLGGDAIRASVMVAAAVAVFTGTGGVVGLFVVAAVFGVVEAAVHPATGAVTPRLVRADSLTAANGLRTMLLRLTAVLGPPVAGVLVTAGEVGWLFLATAVTFLVSFATVLTSGLPAPVRLGA